jgi:hypothetical protein
MALKPPTLTERVESVERALGLRKDETVKWYKNPTVLIPLIPVILSALGLIGAYFAWWQPQWKSDANYQLTQTMDNEIERKLTDHHFDQLVSDVNRMSGQLTEISGFVKVIAASQMQHSASLSSLEFGKNLPVLQATLGAAKATGAAPPPEVVKGIQQKLIDSNHNEVGFWGAASEFVNYKYSRAGQRSLPDCLARRPDVELAENITATQLNLPVTLGYKDCEIDLNSDEVLSHPDWFKWPERLKCTRCKVVYDGGAIPLFATQVKSLTLTDCDLQLHATPESPNNGKNFVTRLLASVEKETVQYDISEGD